VSAHYGEATVLQGVSLEVGAGEVVTLVGRNGAGKTTLLRCLMGLHRSMTGAIRLDGRDIAKLAPHKRCRLGLGYVPDDRGIYAKLTVEENLTLPPQTGPDAWSLSKVYETFPVLKERRRQAGTHLSGGEQQMLSVARVLRMGARLLLADEPTEGLSPILVQQIGDIIRKVKEHGVTVLLIEQFVERALGFADRAVVLRHGLVGWEGAAADAGEELLAEYLGGETASTL